ncbi:MAG TPA: fatty acyl-AMP ligase [Polyangiales bacterium]|nr:fatty acyl-AMP ligase [Polyangiales bacterium]
MVSGQAKDASACESLVELVLQRAEHQADRVAYVFHDFSPRAAPDAREVTTFAELAADAKALASVLQSRGLHGQSVLLLFGSGLDFIRAYLACLLAGSHGVPLRPPLLPDYRQQVLLIAKDANARGVLCAKEIESRVSELFDQDPELSELPILTPDVRHSADTMWVDPQVGRDDIALVQYTSGSTGVPKGVVVTHANLLHNEAAIREAFGHNADTVVVGWLPMFHDMGLIGNVLQTLYLGVPSILMDPLAFLQKPVRLLQLISRYRATTCGGPNFGYDLCVQRVQTAELESLDLSSWSLAYCGSEPVRMQTMQRFAAKFAPVGFRLEAFYPCYGLAECTLFVTGIDEKSAPVSLQVDPSALIDNLIREAPRDEGVAIVSCGYTRERDILRIVDPHTARVCPDGQVGEIWLTGNSVAQGYLHRSDLTDEVFRAVLAESDGRVYLRTGDLGFLRDGELYVSGRVKDLIIIRGTNHYPQDIEETAVRAHDGLRVGCGAAFSVERNGEEQLVLVQEVKRDTFSAEEVRELTACVRAAVARKHGLQLHDLVLVRGRAVPKTSSGKLQRRRCRMLYEAGDLRRITAASAELGA